MFTTTTKTTTTSATAGRWGCILIALCLGILGCASTESGSAPAPHSLHSTVPDGALNLAGDGQFTADEDAVRMFDYFLTAEGEIPESELRALVTDTIHRRLPAAAAEQAVTAFDDYSEYRDETAQLLASDSADPEQLSEFRARFAELHAQTVARVPGIRDDLERVDRALAIRAVLDDRALSTASRDRALATIMSENRALTPAAPERSRIHLTLRAEIAALRASGASAEDIHALRVDRVGAAAADRLAQLERERERAQR
ncbi:MAG: lipase secretion chaperone [Myxococcota bacterium]